MKRTHHIGLWLMGAAFSLAVFSAPASAVNPQTLDIKVSISATKSLSAGTTTYDYGALSVNVSSVSSAIVITNDSGSLTETYTIQGDDADSTGGGTTWTLAGSPGSDQYALAAQFSDAQPSNADGSWASDDLTTSPIVCTSTVLGNGTAGESGASVAPAAARNLFFRLKTPTTVSDTTQRQAVVTVAVQ